MFPLLPTCEAKLFSMLWDCEGLVKICTYNKDQMFKR